MSQPSYHLELLIAGFGTLLAMLIGAFAFWDMYWFPWHILTSDNSNIVVVFLLLPLVYTTGIITDRFTDLTLGRWFIPKINARHFGDNRDAYLKARTLIYVKSESLKSVFEYSRIRIRILRCWLLNSLLIGMASIFFVASPPQPLEGAAEAPFCRFVCEHPWSLSLTIIGVTIFSVGVSFRSWHAMTEAETRNLKFQSHYLAELTAHPTLK